MRNCVLYRSQFGARFRDWANVEIYGCVIDLNTTHGLDVEDVLNTSVSGTRFEGNWQIQKKAYKTEREDVSTVDVSKMGIKDLLKPSVSGSHFGGDWRLSPRVASAKSVRAQVVIGSGCVRADIFGSYFEGGGSAAIGIRVSDCRSLAAVGNTMRGHSRVDVLLEEAVGTVFPLPRMGAMRLNVMGPPDSPLGVEDRRWRHGVA